jgi:hypothetical protein
MASRFFAMVDQQLQDVPFVFDGPWGLALGLEGIDIPFQGLGEG